jgi:PTS system ascorbate-specific IIB component
MLLKMQVEKALKTLGVEATVDLADISTAKGQAAYVDLVITSNELAERIGKIKTPIITVSNFMDVNAIKEGVEAALKDLN